MTMLDDSGSVDLRLVDDTRGGRRDAFAELFRRHHAAAVRFAISLTRGDEAKAQDVVAEAFVRVWRVIVNGGGSVSSFRAYLLTAVRHEYLADLRRTAGIELVADVSTVPGMRSSGDEPPDTPVVAGRDPAVGDAFRSLPDRWRTVLWHTEIEGDRPADIAGAMGLSANAVAALASRAREGLRQEYLQRQVSTAAPACEPYASKLARLVRGTLPRRDERHVESHLRRCAECRQEREQLTALNGQMRSVLPMLIAAAPLWSSATGTAGPGSVAALGTAGLSGAANGAGATGGAAAGAATVGGTVTVGGTATVGGAVTVTAGSVAGLSGVSAAAGMAVASVAAVLGVSIGISAPTPDETTSVSAVHEVETAETTGVVMGDQDAGGSQRLGDTDSDGDDTGSPGASAQGETDGAGAASMVLPAAAGPDLPGPIDAAKVTLEAADVGDSAASANDTASNDTASNDTGSSGSGSGDAGPKDVGSDAGSGSSGPGGSAAPASGDQGDGEGATENSQATRGMPGEPAAARSAAGRPDDHPSPPSHANASDPNRNPNSGLNPMSAPSESSPEGEIASSSDSAPEGPATSEQPATAGRRGAPVWAHQPQTGRAAPESADPASADAPGRGERAGGVPADGKATKSK